MKSTQGLKRRYRNGPKQFNRRALLHSQEDKQLPRTWPFDYFRPRVTSREELLAKAAFSFQDLNMYNRPTPFAVPSTLDRHPADDPSRAVGAPMAAGHARERRALPADGSAMARFAAERFPTRAYGDAHRCLQAENATARHRAYHAENREDLNERQRRRYRSDPHRREKRRARVYGLSDDDYNAILARQHGGCGVCKRTGLELCVDHDHATNKVRGLLCHNCNKALGLFQDNPDVTDAGSAYLRQSLGDG